MIANPDISHPFTLNDLRVHGVYDDAPPSASGLSLSLLALGLVVAIGAFVMLDPLRLFTTTGATQPAAAVVASTGPAWPIETQEIVAPPTPAPATRFVEAPIAPAPVVHAPPAPAPVTRPHAASIKSEPRSNPVDKTSATAVAAAPKEVTAPPALLNKLEERVDAPIVPKLVEEPKSPPKPAATSEPTPATE